MERNVLLYVMQMYSLARDYAYVSNRAAPNTQDLLQACTDSGVDIKEFKRLARKKRSTGAASALPTLVPPLPPLPAPSFLPSDSSDDEGGEADTSKTKSKSTSKAIINGGPSKAKADTKTTGDSANNEDSTNHNGNPKSSSSSNKAGKKLNDAALPKTLSNIPKHLPSLPPKHTYLRTAPPPLLTRTLASLEEKFQTSMLVQESLRTLVAGTEETVPEPMLLPNGYTILQQDGKPPPTLEETGMGGLINFERSERTINGTKRKRWRV
ncbi:hypothetical protein BS47DRAFT_1337388 [Hydnum rufescens UP504]|uniref:Transcription factor TFIID subunit 8 C-terminal domain-containing protein n=1 Tax=Hydnum rufescens UP504 TaxID=1448309 RepID=A0A9P6B846_9AGAM|nr:hypothetical protein BS47DRAFT_1337388 [Hydnum rufescens UP504]